MADDSIPFPCIVKPADSSGSKGVTRVNERGLLREAIEKARDESLTREFMIEGFIEAAGHPSDADALSVNGELVVFSMDDQWFDEKAANIYAPAAFSFPSTMPDWAQKELKSELQRLMQLLDMKTCIYNIEVRLGIDSKPYIMECTPRAGGNRLAEVLRYSSGIDIITASVRGALGLEIDKLPDQI